jgi:putative cell wall-binding protein
VKSVRIISLSAVAALAIGLLGTTAAYAAPDPSSAQVDAKIMYQPKTGPAQPLAPGATVTVEFWKLDESTDYYNFVEGTSWTGPDGSGLWNSSALDPGTYRIRFQASSTDIGVQYWQDARYWFDAEDIVLTAGQEFSLGTITMKPHTFDVDRLFGADRYATAVAISQFAFADGFSAPVVYIADGANYPDALAAGPAAIKQGGVLLLTKSTALPAVTAAELKRLKPARVVIAGGTGAVSNAVKTAVQKAVPAAKVVRLGGATRYETGELIVRDAFKPGEQNVAIVATGRNYPDALAAGPAAGYMGAPVILTDGTAKTLSAATQKLLSDLKAKQVVIVGGTGAVSAGIENRLVSLYGDDTFRFSGASRYDTAAAINANIFGPTDVSFLASGTNFPDALAGAPLAGAMGSALFLTSPQCLTAPADSGITALRSNGIILLGGTGALSAKVESLTACK